MVVDPKVARARFATFVDRALRDARTRGLTDREIQRKSSVATSTFHRWRQADGRGLPELDKVRSFCEAVGADLGDALDALGVTEAPAEATPETPLPRDVVLMLRVLADPNVDDSDREFVRKSIAMLGEQAAAILRRQGGRAAS